MVYANQGSVSTVKGEMAIYLDYVVLGQIIPMRNCSPDIDGYVCEKNEVKMYVPMCDLATGSFKGIEKTIGYIMVRGDTDEVFLSYGYDKTKSVLLYSTFKQALPSIFQGTSFKKHNEMLLNEKQGSSRLFFDLPSTTDRKETINKFRENVQLHSIDCLYDDFVKYLPKNEPFSPQDLDSNDPEKRCIAREVVVNFFKEAIEVPNSNLIRNANTLLLKEDTRIADDFNWINQNKCKDKFKLTY